MKYDQVCVSEMRNIQIFRLFSMFSRQKGEGRKRYCDKTRVSEKILLMFRDKCASSMAGSALKCSVVKHHNWIRHFCFFLFLFLLFEIKSNRQSNYKSLSLSFHWDGFLFPSVHFFIQCILLPRTYFFYIFSIVHSVILVIFLHSIVFPFPFVIFFY